MKKEILFSIKKEDFDVQTFRAGGKGGQNQNKRNTGVRIIHRPSGAVGESREERSQAQNKKNAFTRLVNCVKMKLWINQKAGEIIRGKTIEQVVEEQLKPENLKIEMRNEKGAWEDVKSNS